VLLVTKVRFNDFACAPINMSNGPIKQFLSFKSFLIILFSDHFPEACLQTLMNKRAVCITNL